MALRQIEEIVRGYPCLYDKSKKDYKTVIKNSWKEIAEKLDFIENAERAEICFENLKRNYTRKRSSFRNTRRSESSRHELEKAKHEFEQFSFLNWLGDFMRPRKPKQSRDNNISASCQPSTTLQYKSSVEDSDEGSFEHFDDVEDRKDLSLNLDSMVSPGVTDHDTPPENINIFPSRPALKGKKRAKRKFREGEMDNERPFFLTNQCEAEARYVATIADRLRSLPPREKLLAKHDIENTLFKYQMQVVDNINRLDEQSGQSIVTSSYTILKKFNLD